MLELLPVDVYRWELLPYLDWSSRLNLNLAMPKNCRIVERFTREELIGHEVTVLITLVKGRFNKLDEEYDRDRQAQKMIDIFNLFTLPRSKILIIHYKNFREALIERSKHYSNGALTSRRDRVVLPVARKLARLCRNLLLEISTLVFADTQYPSRAITLF